MDPRTLAGQIASVGRYRAQVPPGLVVDNHTFCANALAEAWGMPLSELMVAVRLSLLHEDGTLRFGVWMHSGGTTHIQVRPRRDPQGGKGNNKGVRKGKGFVKGVRKGKCFVKGLGKGGGDGRMRPFDQANGDEDDDEPPSPATEDEEEADRAFLDRAADRTIDRMIERRLLPY